MALLSAFTDAILPVLAVAGVGYVVGRVRDVDARTLSTVILYVLVPALVFHSVATMEFTGTTAAKIVGSAVVLSVAMWLLSEGVAVASGLEGDERNGFVLTGTFSNTANYGIPLSTFAFPAVGKTTAVLYTLGFTLAVYTLGVAVAARGDVGPRDAVRRVFRLPIVYAVVAGALYAALDVSAPASTMDTIRLVGDSSIPLMLLLLGVQVARSTPGGQLADLARVNALKLLVAPAVAVPVVWLLGFDDPDVGRVVVLETAMPSAVSALMLAVEFDGDADFVSGAIVSSTLISPFVLTPLIVVLRSGVVI